VTSCAALGLAISRGLHATLPPMSPLADRTSGIAIFPFARIRLIMYFIMAIALCYRTGLLYGYVCKIALCNRTGLLCCFACT
jgi:hypothetical protein